MSTVNSFEELIVWQKARTLCKEVFNLTQLERFSNDHKLKDQINSSAGSIMDNIAEGFGRGGKSEFIYFLFIANGSNLETKSQLVRAFDRKYITPEQYEQLGILTDEISKMLFSLVASLKASNIKGTRYK